MRKVLVEFQIPDDCLPSTVSKFIMSDHRILMSIDGLATGYALELIETDEFPIDHIKAVWNGEIDESENSLALHSEWEDEFVIEALKKNPFWGKLTSSTNGHYYFKL